MNEKETGRIEAFSDGVFGIAITLLVLNVKIPTPDQTTQGGLLSALIVQWPIYLALIASFFFILVMWINHHRLFTVIRKSDNNLMLLNGLLLFGVTIVPFPTALAAQYLQDRDQVIAIMIYNGWFFFVAICFNILWAYASYNNRLFSPQTDLRLARHIARQYIWGPLLYLVAILSALISPLLSLLMSLLLAVFFALPNKAVQRLSGVEPEQISE